MESRDIERYWERVNELIDPITQKGNRTMNQYGQAESVGRTLLNVTKHFSYVVGFRVRSPEGFPYAYLTRYEVKLLITQLQTWVDQNTKERT